MNTNMGKFQEMVRDREAWRAAVHGIGHNWATEQQDLKYLAWWIWQLYIPLLHHMK